MQAVGARRWWALVALALSGWVVGLDLTVLNVALPTLSADLHASTSDLQWFANSYNLVLAAVLVLAGLLGDRYGRKKMLFGALVLFGVASVACAFSTSVGQLIGARAFLGLGAAFLIPMCMAVLPVLFPDPAERQRAFSSWILANALGIPLGPIVGGLLLDNYWWGSVFLINVPVIVLAVIAVAVLLPESRSSRRPSIDLIGVLLSSAGLVGVTYGVVHGGEAGWTTTLTLSSLALGVLALLAFVAWELRASGRATPLVDLALFKAPGFTWGAILAMVVSFALFGLIFLMPQYFQAIGGTDALGTGLRLLPLIGGLLVGSRVADRLVPRFGARVVAAAGFVLVGGALLVGASTSVTSGYGFVAAWFSLCGIGLGFTLPVTMGAALGALTAERSGVGSAVLQALRQVGGVVGVSVLGAVVNAAYQARLTGPWPAAALGTARRGVTAGLAVARQLHSAELVQVVRGAFMHSMAVMLVTSGAIAVVGALLSAAFLPGRASGSGASVEGPEPEDAQSAQELVL
jgi:EmrB/QacA subfamily drug resistance transporter